MNSFLLALNPIIAARHHVNRHVSKMQTEYAQIVSSALRLNGYAGDDVMKISYAKHPTIISASQSRGLCEWLIECYFELTTIHESYNGHQHASRDLMYRALDLLHLVPCDRHLLDTIPACSVFNSPDNEQTILKYRKFYTNDKVMLADWTWGGNERPDWFDGRYFDYNIAWMMQSNRNKNLKRPITQQQFDAKVAELF